MKKIAILSVGAVMSLCASAARVHRLQVWSESMRKNVEAAIITPDKYERDPGAEWPVVYVLHGAGGSARLEADSADIWRYADQYDVIFVCPDGAVTSWWLDSPIDPKMRYETFVVKELVPWVDERFRTYGTRTQRAIMGGSMGGYGACRLGFRHKDLFGAVGNIYGGVDFWNFPNNWEIARRLGPRDRFPERWREFAAITEAAKLKSREIELITVVGTQDFFLDCNRAMHRLLADNGVSHTYVEICGETREGSSHTRDFACRARALILPFLANYFETGKAQIAKGRFPLAKRHTVKVTKKIWTETAAPTVELPANWKIVEGDDGLTALDVRDYYFTIEAPCVADREPSAPTVRLTWPGVGVSGVYGATNVTHAGDTWTFVPTGRVRLGYYSIFDDGPIQNSFNHHVEGTQHGPYRNRPLPWTQLNASANWRAACWAMFRRAGFTTMESTDGAHINLYGYDTNFPYRHVDYPNHFHIMLEWGGFTNNNVGHYTLNSDGSISGNNFLVCGAVAGYPHSGYYPQKPGETTAYNGPKGNTLFTVEMLADGSGIILRKPGEKREWRCRSTHADEGVILSERADANALWRDLADYSTDDRPAEGRLEVVEQRLPSGEESRTVIRYNRDTGDFLSLERPAGASETTVLLRYDRGGAIEEKSVEATPRADGMSLTLSPEETGAFRSLEIVPEIARAKTGEAGYFILPNNVLGTFRKTEGEYVLAAKDATMAFWGMKTARKTFVCQIRGMRWDWTAVVRARKGAYSVATRFTQEDERPYEPIVLDWTFLPADAEYPAMAKLYRARQIAATGLKTLRERAKERPPLGRAVEAPEVRIRMSWKPAPSPVAEQNEFNEPPLKVAVTFARAREFIEACHAAGIGRAEFCLVGWKCRGHDGRYPQIWPVEEQLGGAEGLRKTAAAARALGYNIVLHSNSTDAYSVADCWDEADCIKLKNGELDTCEYMWGGGKPYKLCLQRAYERFARKDFAKMKALGMSGIHYTDVMTVEPVRRCLDPRHPCTKAETVRWMRRILAEATRNVGGVGSEGPIDLAPDLQDLVLYVSYETPGGKKLHPMLDRLVPLWQIVYHGAILSMPFSECTNFTVQGNDARLALVEFGGRPMFYVNSDYMTGLRWMGEKDLYLYTDDDLKRTVAELKRGADEYARLSDLQYETIDDHALLAPNVARTVYANGAETVVNRSAQPFAYRGTEIPAGDWKRFRHLR